MLSHSIRLGLVVTAVSVSTALPALAQVYRCKSASGPTAVQETPCDGAGTGQQLTVKPASGYADRPVPATPSTAASAPAKPLTEAQRIEVQIADSQRNRRRQDLQERMLPSAQAALVDHRQTCKVTQEHLAASRYAYNQNLYGKIHAAQMASEMAAAAATCDTKDRELKDTIDTLQKECGLVGCRP